MVYVPWQALGICKFHAMHKTTCHQGDKCAWQHPPEDVVRNLWTQYQLMEERGQIEPAEVRRSAESFEKAPATQNHHLPPASSMSGGNQASFSRTAPQNHLPARPDVAPPPFYVREGSQRPDDFHIQGAYHRRDSMRDGQPPLVPPWRAPAWVPDQLDTFDSRPPSHDHARDVLTPFSQPLSQGTYTRPISPPPQIHMTPWPSFAKMPPLSDEHHTRVIDGRAAGTKRKSDGMMPENTTETKRRRGSSFDPYQSENPFVNGSQGYRFVWGNPLCVECGVLGHLPRDNECEDTKLSRQEQDYLFKMVQAERNRHKTKQGLDRGQLSSGLDPTPTPEPERPIAAPEKSSVLRAFEQPRTKNGWKSQGPLESQAGYWERAQSRKPLRSLLRDEESIASGNISHGHKAEYVQPKRKRMMVEEESDEDVKAAKRTKHEVGTDQPRSEFGDSFGIGPFELEEPQPATTAAKEVNEDQRSPYFPSSPPPELPTSSEPASSSPLPTMGATKRLSNGEAKNVGPHPSTIRVSASYMTQSAIEKRLQPPGLDAQERSQAEAREDSVRLQGVAWLDNVRRALQLPVKTYTTACVYYHKFRLAHPTVEYSYTDAAAASLLTSCKNEDTLKKSRDILAAAYNLKQSAAHEQVGADDPIFEAPSRVVIGLERLVLESGGFDFRSRSPHHTLVKISKSLPKSDDLRKVSQLAWTILTDIHRTFAVLKQTSSTLALASLELAAHFVATTSPNNACTVRDDLQALDLNTWHTTREEVMETLLDAMDLYTHHTASSILGSKYSLDNLLRIRLALNKECTDSTLPRYTTIQPPASPDNANGSSNTLRVANGHPTPVSPPQPGTQASQQANGTGLNLPTPDGGVTLRFMLNPQRATEERIEVNRYYTEEWEEYEEEIEVPIPRNHSRDREHDRRRDFSLDRRPPGPGRGPPRDDRFDDRRSMMRDEVPPPPRLRGPPPPIERDVERERARYRDRERDRRYDDRRYDERERDRRYDERRDRRYYEDDRRHGRDDRR